MAVLKKALTIFLSVFLLTNPAFADVVDRVVAIVNNDVITLSEVNHEGKVLMQRITESVPPSELAEALRKARQTIIDKLIEKKIMLQEAEKAQVSVGDQEVEMAYKRILEINNISEEEFVKQLAAMGMDMAQYKEDLKTQVLSSKLVNLEIRSKVIIPEDRIIDYYDSHYTERVGEGGFYLLQIGIRWDEKAPMDSGIPKTRQAARERAEEIRNLALQGEDFKELARNNSNFPSAADGGDIGILKSGDMSPEMLEILSRTKTGEITPLIETSAGYQFFKVLASREGQIVTRVPYESVKDEIHEILYQQEMEARYDEWLKKMKENAYIKIL